MKRVEANDPVAVRQVGPKCFEKETTCIAGCDRKENYATALRVYHDIGETMNNPQRQEAVEYYEKLCSVDEWHQFWILVRVSCYVGGWYWHDSAGYSFLCCCR